MKVVILVNTIFFFMVTYGMFDHLIESGKMSFFGAFAIGFVVAIQIAMSILAWRKHS